MEKCMLSTPLAFCHLGQNVTEASSPILSSLVTWKEDTFYLYFRVLAVNRHLETHLLLNTLNEGRSYQRNAFLHTMWLCKLVLGPVISLPSSSSGSITNPTFRYPFPNKYVVSYIRHRLGLSLQPWLFSQLFQDWFQVPPLLSAAWVLASPISLISAYYD